METEESKNTPVTEIVVNTKSETEIRACLQQNSKI